MKLYADESRALQRKLMEASVKMLTQEGIRDIEQFDDKLETLAHLAIDLCEVVKQRKDGCSVELLAATEAISAVAGYQEVQTRQATLEEFVMAGAALGRAEVMLWIAANKGLEKADAQERGANGRRAASAKATAVKLDLKRRALAEAKRWQQETGETKAKPTIAYLETWLRSKKSPRSWECIERWVSEMRKG